MIGHGRNENICFAFIAKEKLKLYVVILVRVPIGTYFCG